MRSDGNIGYREPPLLTVGDDLTDLGRFLPPDADDDSAHEVIDPWAPAR